MEGLFPLLVAVFFISSLMSRISVSRQAQQKPPQPHAVRKEQPPTFRQRQNAPAQAVQPVPQRAVVPQLAAEKAALSKPQNRDLDFVSLEDQAEQQPLTSGDSGELKKDEGETDPMAKFGERDLVHAVIASEILGKPKALRHRITRIGS